MKYRKGYKYQLASNFEVVTRVYPNTLLISEFIRLDIAGVLHIKSGYAWDGPSGPTIDTRSSMRGSLIHDALYQLLREEKLNAGYRRAADQELYRICLEDGMWKWRAKLWLREVSKFAGSAADPKNKKPIITAP